MINKSVVLLRTTQDGRCQTTHEASTMSKLMFCDPNTLEFPAAGGSAKFRLKNPDTKKFLYQLEISNTDLYMVDMVPLGIVQMGDSKVVTVTRKAGPAGEAKLTYKYYAAPPNPNDFEIPEVPLGTFECKLVAK